MEDSKLPDRAKVDEILLKEYAARGKSKREFANRLAMGGGVGMGRSARQEGGRIDRSFERGDDSDALMSRSANKEMLDCSSD